MRHIDEIQIAGTAILLCGAMFAVSAVAPTGNTVSKAVTNFNDAKMLAELSEDLGEAMVGINEQEIEILMAERGK
jgi:pyridoxal 5'-phosphate synthase pdxS subunit